MKKIGRFLFGSALLAVLLLGLSAALAPPAQAFEWFDTCPTNACVSEAASLGVCENDVGQFCRVFREGSWSSGHYGENCLGQCF